MKKGLFWSALVFFAGAGVSLGQGLPASALPWMPPAPGLGPEANPSSGVFDDRTGARGGSGGALRFWASAEYLYWWTKGSSLPPLVTTGPAFPVTPSPGSFAAPGTTVLFGGDDRNRDTFMGGRFTLGFWCNRSETIGAEAVFFFLGQRSDDFSTSTSGAPGSAVLARPFFDTSTGMANSELVGYPGLAAGSVNIHSYSGLMGAESNLLFNLCRSCDTSCNFADLPAKGYRVDLLAGLRYMELREGITIAENTQVNPAAPVFAGDNISAYDQFNTLNRFYGGQLGIRSEWWWKRVFVNATGMVAFGDTHQTVDINGATRTTTPGGASTLTPGDLLALPSNIGTHTRDQFSIVPEAGFNVGYQVTSHLRLFAGYTFIYWSNVERPGDAINLNVNSTRVPASTIAPSGPFDPQFNLGVTGRPLCCHGKQLLGQYSVRI